MIQFPQSQLKWKCPDCGLISSCSLDTPCAACFWTISKKQKLLLDLVNSKDRNSKVFCVLWKHLNQRDVVKLILEFDPTNSLLDCSVELGEETQEEYIEKYVFGDGDPGRVLIRTALSAETSKAFCEMVTSDEIQLHKDNGTRLVEVEQYQGFQSHPKLRSTECHSGAFGKLMA